MRLDRGYIFVSSSTDVDYKQYDNKECIIIRKLGADEVDDEVGEMFEIEFLNGNRIHAFKDELDYD